MNISENMNRIEHNNRGSHEENYGDNLKIECRKFVQESKKTDDSGLYQDQNFIIKNILIFFENDRHPYNTSILCRNFVNTIATVKILIKHERICNKNETCIMESPEEKTFN